MNQVEKVNLFYEIIRSNDLRNLKNVLQSTHLDGESLFLHLAEAFEKIKLSNDSLKEDVEFEVVSKLVDLQFFTEDVKPEILKFKSFDEIKNHLDFLCNFLKSFVAEYCDKNSVDNSEFIFKAKYLARNMSTIKRTVEFSYVFLPWEEMEFCLVMYIKSLIKPKETDVVYNLILDKDRVLKHLQYFSNDLEKVKDDFTEDNFKTKLKALRNEQKAAILIKSPYFVDLYNDFFLLRNVYSLNKIKFYIEQAVSTDLKQNKIIGQLIIERTLQVMGEYMKNTPDSPNLSDDLYNVLLKTAPRHLKIIMVNLRDMLSHSSSLSRKLEFASRKDVDFFIKIQNDLRKIYNEILYILFKQKIDAINIFLKKILVCHDVIKIKVLIIKLTCSKIEDDAKSLDSNEFTKLKEMIKQFISHVHSDIQDPELIDKVNKTLDFYDSRITNIIVTYNSGIKNICKLETLSNIQIIHNLCRTYLAEMFASDPRTLHREIFGTMKILYDIFRGKTVPNNFEEIYESEEKFNKYTTVSNLWINLYHLCKNEIRKIRWIEDMKEQLTSVEDFQQRREDVDNILENIQKSLDLQTDKLCFSDIIVKKKEIYASKLKAINCTDSEALKSILKCFSLSRTVEKEILRNFGKPEGISKIKQIPDDYGTLVNKLGDMFPLGDYTNMFRKFFNKLKLKKPLYEKIDNEFNKIIKDQVKTYYNSRVLTLKIVIHEVSIPSSIKTNRKLISALEILVLDLLEYLENINFLGDYKTFLIEPFPVLVGKQLRNYLAHGNLLNDILLFDPKISLIYYATRLAQLGKDLLNKKGIVGYTIDRSFDFRQYVDTCLKVIRTQKSKIANLGNSTSIKHMLLVKLYGNDQVEANEWTPLDFAIMSGHTEKVNPILESELLIRAFDSCYNLQTCTHNLIYEVLNMLHLAIKYGHTNTVIMFLENIDINVTDQDNWTLLHKASYFGHSEIVNILVKNGAKVNVLNKNLCSPLHLASQCGHYNVVKILLEHNIDVTTEDKRKWTSLHWAANNNHQDIVQLLILQDNFVEVRDNDGKTPLHLAAMNGFTDIMIILFEKVSNVNVRCNKGFSALHYAVENGHDHTVVTLLQNYEVDVNSKNNDDETPLMLAVSNGNMVSIKNLLERGAETNIKSRKEGYTALTKAAELGYTDILLLLINHGADIEAIENVKQWRALHWAVQDGYTDIVKILIKEGVDVKATVEQNITALHIAVRNASLEIIEMLTSAGADLNAMTKNNILPLKLAAELGHKEVVLFLLVNKASVDALSGVVSALHVAAKNGFEEIVEMLIQYGANVNIEGEGNLTPLHYAAREDRKNVVNLLIKKGSKIDCRDMWGLTPFHIAVQQGQKFVAELFLESYDVDPNIITNERNQWTALHMASVHGHTEIVQCLIKHGAKVNQRNSDNCTPLSWAVQKSNLKVVEILLENGAEVGVKDISGATSLHIACQNGHEGIVKLLLEKEPNVDLETNQKITPLQLAINNKHHSIIGIILELSKSDANFPIYGLITKLHIAAMEGLHNIVNTLLQNNAEVDAKDAEDLTPLHLAAQNGHVDVVKILLSHGANIDCFDIYRRTPLILALKQNHETTALYLIRKNANISIKTKNFLTPLFLAVMNGLFKVVDELLRHKVDIESPFNNLTPLMFALLASFEEIGLILLNNEANFNITDESGLTPLHIAVGRNLSRVVDRLLELGANVNSKRDDNLTPLYLAVEIGNSYFVSKLLHKKANPNEKLKTNGRTALHEATSKGSKEIVLSLLHNAADVKIKDNQDRTSLHIASSKGLSDIFEILLEYGADIESVDGNGFTVLHYAAHQGHDNILKLILNKKVDMINTTDLLDTSAIFYAVGNNHPNAVLELLKCGADITKKVRNIMTVLHVAAAKGSTDIVKLLLKTKDISAIIDVQTDKEQFTALHIACTHGFRDVVALLLRYGANVNIKNVEEFTAVEIAEKEGRRDIVSLFFPNKIGDLPT